VNITKATLTRLLFSPFMLFNPLPVEQKDRAIAEGSKRLFILGAIDFTKAIAVMFIAWQMLDPQFQFDNSDFFSTLLHGYWKFIFLVLIRFAWSFLFVGAGRWMGFNMSDPIRVPLLATNFFDYKKRSQSYMFNWSMTLFYAPIFGKTGSTFLAAFLAFTIQGIILSWSRFPSSLGVYVTWTLIPVAVASALIAFAAATPSLWPSGRKWSGWFGVLIVNAVLGLITGAQFYLPH